MEIRFTRKFKKLYKKSPAKIRSAFEKRLEVFISNPYHSLLNNHALSGKFKGCSSINITGDWRAIYSKQPSGLIIFEVLGTHSQLYK